MDRYIDLKGMRAEAEKEGALTVSSKLLIAICDRIDELEAIAEIKDPEQHFEQIMSANKALSAELLALKQELLIADDGEK